MLSKKLLFVLGSATGALGGNAIDSTFFRRLAFEITLDSPILASVATKYAYDSNEQIDKVQRNFGLAKNGPLVTSVELDFDDKDKDDSGEEETDYQAKERESKEQDMKLAEELGLRKDDLPQLLLIKNGKIVSSMKMDHENDKSEEVLSWVEQQGFERNEVNPIVVEFAGPMEDFANASSDDERKQAIEKAETLVDDSADSNKAEIVVALLKKAAKKGSPEKYAIAEKTRLQNIVDSGAVTADKASVMRTKILCLKFLTKAFAKGKATPDL